MTSNGAARNNGGKLSVPYDAREGTEQITTEAVKSFLKANPDVLEAFVLSSAVSIETLQKWKARKGMNGQSIESSNKVIKARRGSKGDSIKSEWTLGNLISKRRTLLDLSTDMAMNGDTTAAETKVGTVCLILYELMCSAVQATAADGGNLYNYVKDMQELHFYRGYPDANERSSNPTFKPGTGTTISAYVAKTHNSIRTNDVARDSRFPDGVGGIKSSVSSVICLPLVDAGGVLLGVMELYRSSSSAPFTDKDLEVATLISVWGCHGIYFSQLVTGDELFRNMSKQRKLNDFLLTVTKSIFHDIISMDAVIMKVMNFAQKLVNANRASLFLVDHKTKELYARIFDVGTEGEEAIHLDEKGGKEIRFPMDRGIAGHVAVTGEILNIEDAYGDERFNREIDVKTGYKTRTILCMPIYIRGTIIGVMQMVNKSNGVFTHADEQAFQAFAVYCGLALHHAKLYDRIRRSEQKYKVAIEVLAYHSLCTRDEIQKLKKVPVPERIEVLETYDVHPLRLSELEKPRYAIYMFKDLFTFQGFDVNSKRLSDIEKPVYALFMFKDLFSLRGFEMDDLVRFVLTVRKNYRRVPYHNWTHGWSVAHAMYVILKTSNIFTKLEALSMYVACLCHDLDHRGKNNAFMKSFKQPLAAIYSTSVMEHHHFNQCVTILQHEGHNIFRSLSPEDYKWVLGNIKHCILATDLALFFPNRARLQKLSDEGQFKIDDPDHRKLLQAVCMTACDLIASAKPWEVQRETVNVIFEEFYEQGDAERENGREPIAMMDRHKGGELPSMQVGFMSGICLPCYKTLSGVLPNTNALVEKCSENLKQWQLLADQQKANDSDKAIDK